jgi:hypothetical protein
LILRILVISFALPRVKQSGQTQLPARSKLPRRFGKFMHQHLDLPGGTPQLKLAPHSSHTSLSIGLPYNKLTASASAMDQPKSNNLSMTDDGISVDTNGQPRFYDINKSGDQPRQIAKI